MSDDQTTVFENIACTKCGCVCDDLTVRVRNNVVESFSPGCSVAEPWFQQLKQPINCRVAEIRRVPASLTEAVSAAKTILRSSRAPLFFGLSRSSTDGQRAVCELADHLGATIDTTASIGHGPSIMAVQGAGESTSTLGEIRHRSNLIFYWGSDPEKTHPRHMQRIVAAPGFSVPRGRADRFVVVVDSERTATAEKADLFLQIERGHDFEVLWALRALVQGTELTEESIGGVPLPTLQMLSARMKTCHYGTVFFGVSLAESTAGHLSVEALLRLVTELNLHTRFVVRRMRVPGDVTGADSVLCWQTGYPFSVSLNRGYPRYNPGEYSANQMLERMDTDCVILVGAERVHRLSKQAQQNLAKLPVILLDYPTSEWGVRSDVRFNTAIYGVHRRATAYRMDEVPIPLRQILHSDLPSDDEVLRAILKQLRPPA